MLAGINTALALLLLAAERWLADYGECGIEINAGERRLRVRGGESLLASLPRPRSSSLPLAAVAARADSASAGSPPVAGRFGARTTRDLYYVEEFQELARRHAWFEYVPVLSADAGGDGFRRGLVTEALAADYERLDRHEAYLCGSPGMIDTCERVLREKGMPSGAVFYNKF